MPFLTALAAGSTACAVSVTLVVTSTRSGAAAAGGPQTLTLDQPRVVIGRGAHADVRLPARAVSDKHALVHVEYGEISVTDEGSTNGTAVNGQALVRGRKKVLREGDKIQVPGYQITVVSSTALADSPDRTATIARKLLADALSDAGEEAAPPELHLRAGRKPGQRWKLPPAPARLIAGRGETCEIPLDDADCSRQHAEFVREGELVTVRDLGSKNGVIVGERRVNERRLRDGDEVQLGRSVLVFSDPAEALLRALDMGPDESGSPLPPPEAASPPPSAVIESKPAGVSDDAAATIADGVVPATEKITPGSEPPAAIAPSKSEAPPSGTKQVARVARRSADWIVVALAAVILAVSAAALYVLLRGTPLPGR